MKSVYYILDRRVMKYMQKTFIVQINTTLTNQQVLLIANKHAKFSAEFLRVC
jgi:thermostable 8-oxoguanine DNA glycosylase